MGYSLSQRPVAESRPSIDSRVRQAEQRNGGSPFFWATGSVIGRPQRAWSSVSTKWKSRLVGLARNQNAMVPVLRGATGLAAGTAETAWTRVSGSEAGSMNPPVGVMVGPMYGWVGLMVP